MKALKLSLPLEVPEDVLKARMWQKSVDLWSLNLCWHYQYCLYENHWQPCWKHGMTEKWMQMVYCAVGLKIAAQLH